MAAGIALLVIGGATGWGVTQYSTGTTAQAPENQFVRRALNAHVVYAHDANRPVELRSTEQKRLINWLSDRLDHKLMTPDLAGKGFHLIGGRLVNDQSMRAALFMYEDKFDKRVSLYVRPGMVGGNTKFRFIAEHGTVAFYWTNGPLTYALTGEIPCTRS
ncbi:MAG: anti-sigma factor [Rhodospirillaceae bacterium]|jgi:anti-sigma factor RsiW